MHDRTKALLEQRRARCLPGVETAHVFQFQERLTTSQWQPRAQLEAFQLASLKTLIDHTRAHNPFWQVRLPEATLSATTVNEALARIPLVSRSAVQEAGERLSTNVLPSGQNCVGTRSSSGSTGMPVSVLVTDYAMGWQNALNLRAHIWALRDFDRTIASIRRNKPGLADYPEGTRRPAWDAPSIFPFQTGESIYLNALTSVRDQWEWLARMQPAYLMTYPSLLNELADIARKAGPPPRWLRGASAVGETVGPEIRETVRKGLGVDIHETYSAEEVGMIAIQCPTSRRLHCQSESIIVEVLDDRGAACKPGEVGRVVVTPLHNFATPLFRYDIGDLAEVAAPCACGRHLPSLARVMGRQRNILRLADGRTFWPSFGRKTIRKIGHIRQQQFRQTTYNRLEAHLVADRPLTDEERSLITAEIQSKLPAPFDVAVVEVAAIRRSESGKFEEFICEVGAG